MPGRRRFTPDRHPADDKWQMVDAQGLRAHPIAQCVGLGGDRD